MAGKNGQTNQEDQKQEDVQNVQNIQTGVNAVNEREEEQDLDDQSVQPMGNEGALPVNQVAEEILPVGNEANQDIFPDQMQIPSLFYVDPELSEEEKNEQLLLQDMNEQPVRSDTLMTLRPKRRNAGTGRGRSLQADQGNIPLADNDLNRISQDMQPAAGWNFNAQKFPARKQTGWFRRFLTGTARFAGKTVGKFFNVAQNLVRFTYFKKRYRQSVSTSTENPKIRQERRQHELIPGWNGAKYEKAPDGQDNILEDFRRVPVVWSKVTSAKAVDDNGKPLPPTVSVNVKQPKEGVDQMSSGTSVGHSGLGIEYSRYSRISNRYERYALKYGFYMAGGSLAMGSLAGIQTGFMPGQLLDESSASFWTISRTLPATTRQVSDIVKASETYADKGYNGVTRNCTTFVKEMVRDVAHISAGDDIFKMETPEISSLGNFGIFVATAHETNARINAEERFEQLAGQEDLSYAGLNNKRVNKEDYRHYKSGSRDYDRLTKSDIPNAVAENMRRLEGENSGLISSSAYIGTLPKSGSMGVNNLEAALEAEGNALLNSILKVTGKRSIEELYNVPDLPWELRELLGYLGDAGMPVGELIRGENNPETIRSARAMIDEQIEKLNTVLFRYFGNDRRLNVPVLHMISILTRAADFMDKAYRMSDYASEAGGDLGNLRSEALRVQYSISAGGVETMMTASDYEAYLQVYKTPQAAIAGYARFKELEKIQDTGSRKLTGRETKELEKLERMDKLASQFDQAHRYMLEKGAYSAQDINYAFSLRKRENKDDVDGTLLDKSAGRIYQALILETVFGGMRARFTNHIRPEDAKDNDRIRAFLENDLAECMSRRREVVVNVMRALKKYAVIPDPDSEYLMFSFNSLMSESWFTNVFQVDAPVENARNSILMAYSEIMSDAGSPVRRMVAEMLQSVMSEREEEEPEALFEL